MMYTKKQMEMARGATRHYEDYLAGLATYPAKTFRPFTDKKQDEHFCSIATKIDMQKVSRDKVLA